MAFAIITIKGNLTQNPELRQTQGGEVCNLSVAVNSGVGDKKTVVYYKVSVFGRSAANCGNYLVKGQEVVVNGSFKPEEYTNDKGVVKTAFKINANVVDFGRAENTNKPTQPPQSNYNNASKPQYNYSQKPEPQEEQYPDSGTEDDLPF